MHIVNHSNRTNLFFHKVPRSYRNFCGKLCGNCGKRPVFPIRSLLWNPVENVWTVFYFRQYRTKLVRQMRRQIFRQMKQKAVLPLFTNCRQRQRRSFRPERCRRNPIFPEQRNCPVVHPVVPCRSRSRHFCRRQPHRVAVQHCSGIVIHPVCTSDLEAAGFPVPLHALCSMGKNTVSVLPSTTKLRKIGPNASNSRSP